MGSVVQPSVELLGLLRRQGGEIRQAIWDLQVALIKGNAAHQAGAQEALAARLAELLGLADLLGRRRVALAAARLPARAAGDPEFGAGLAGLVPKVTWAEAVEDIATRYPMTVPPQVRDLGATAVQEWIGSLYQAQGFTLARTTQAVVVERVQGAVRRALEGGQTREQALEAILSSGAEHGDDWTRAYAETVRRNNTNTAYSSGLHEQMGDPDVQRVIGALGYSAAMDGDTTPICRAAHGTVAPADHWIWDHRTPGLHHGCRSGLRFLSWTELEQTRRLKDGVVVPYIPNWPPTAEQKPQPGFGGRR